MQAVRRTWSKLLASGRLLGFLLRQSDRKLWNLSLLHRHVQVSRT